MTLYGAVFVLLFGYGKLTALKIRTTDSFKIRFFSSYLFQTVKLMIPQINVKIFCIYHNYTGNINPGNRRTPSRLKLVQTDEVITHEMFACLGFVHCNSSIAGTENICSTNRYMVGGGGTEHEFGIQ